MRVIVLPRVQVVTALQVLVALVAVTGVQGLSAADAGMFGQSAGALSTCLHLVARGSEGLADAFVMQSGACVAGTGRLRSRERLVSTSSLLATALCPLQDGDALVRCLRERPALDFASVLAPGVASAEFWPYVDHDLFAAGARSLIEQGKLVDAPLIVGSTLHERRFFDDVTGLPLVFDRISFDLNVRLGYGDAAGAVIEHYAPASDSEAAAAWGRLWTDEYFRCPARLLARLASERGRAVYLYSFDAPPAVHSQELDYVFDWPCCGVSARYPEAGYPLLSEARAAIQGYWTNMARQRDPNAAGLPTWPAYTRANDAHMSFGRSVAASSALSAGDCDFWDAVYAAASP